HTLRADIDYGFSEAKTTYGVIGVKCWVYRGDRLAHGEAPGVQPPAQEEERRPRRPGRPGAPGDRRGPPPGRGDRAPRQGVAPAASGSASSRTSPSRKNPPKSAWATARATPSTTWPRSSPARCCTKSTACPSSWLVKRSCWLRPSCRSRPPSWRARSACKADGE